MKKTSIIPAILVLLFILTSQSCKKKCEATIDAPACIKAEIDKIKARPVRNPAASVWRYTYNNQTVYFIPAGCCDMPSVLFDSNCNVICSPDGGFTGAGDGQCADFFTARTNEVQIWHDNR